MIASSASVALPASTGAAGLDRVATDRSPGRPERSIGGQVRAPERDTPAAIGGSPDPLQDLPAGQRRLGVVAASERDCLEGQLRSARRDRAEQGRDVLRRTGGGLDRLGHGRFDRPASDAAGDQPFGDRRLVRLDVAPDERLRILDSDPLERGDPRAGERGTTGIGARQPVEPGRPRRRLRRGRRPTRPTRLAPTRRSGRPPARTRDRSGAVRARRFRRPAEWRRRGDFRPPLIGCRSRLGQGRERPTRPREAQLVALRLVEQEPAASALLFDREPLVGRDRSPGRLTAPGSIASRPLRRRFALALDLITDSEPRLQPRRS